ncbi:Gmad2 immunoglobulin-like domain-containing protein [Dactylosporangium sp. CA-233914]|uniref:Gmad2 immunoglobulin-like domain-containing protein n=1 Tax=Dactylosporangium sp. CA-233914 TaxID=3239934 RepID=UPI003D93F520
MRPGQAPEERLREALRARADEVEVAPDALPRIRMRTAGNRRRGRWAALGAVVATAAAVGAVAVVVQATRDGQHNPPSTTISEKSDTPPSGGPQAPHAVNLPVYFSRGGRLYREFLPAALPQDTDTARIRAAVEMSLTGRAVDPDYHTLWPQGVTVRAVSIAGSEVTVDLGNVGTGPANGGTPGLAAQQLVYTVLAVSTYTSIKHSDGVRLLVDGAPVAKLWGSVDTGRPLRQAAMADVQAPVWVIEPEQGAVVGKTFTVYLAGIVSEGTVSLRVRDSAGNPVDERVVQLSAGAPALGEARVTLTLPSGRYTVEAYFISQKDGSVQWVDDHEFTVA